MNAYGWDEPAPYREPPDVSDREYHLMQDRIDNGDECPKCHATRIVSESPAGVAIFRCRDCSTKWMDLR